MNTLILKLGATGDVVRTTPLLKHLAGNVSWLTAAKNVPLLDGLTQTLRCVSWEQRARFCDRDYDLVINLEDTLEVAQFVHELKFKKFFGAYAVNGALTYTDDSRDWFDLSLISRFGRQAADRLKLENRRTYQDMIFSGLGLQFKGEKYFLPEPALTDLAGDVAIAPKAGHVWPMKNWAYYGELKTALESLGLTVNVLPERPSLLEHFGDVRNHRCLVSGDSLPMHLALAAGTRCVTLFTCTGPWEIYPYGIQRQITSPLLAEFFFQRGLDERAIKAITLDEVLAAVLDQLR
ncbi:MAG TPA: glycosyltransferase family 9 protein [Candidatus Acidoferrales bacterium]|nr:glycosyltransferase family 9 protein [Candidatus Acidoferrales bacterium]